MINTKARNEYSLQQDLILLSRYEQEGLLAIQEGGKSEWEVRTEMIKHKAKFEVIREALTGMNLLGIRPFLSIRKIIEIDQSTL